jgi:hypothetical protein
MVLALASCKSRIAREIKRLKLFKWLVHGVGGLILVLEQNRPSTLQLPLYVSCLPPLVRPMKLNERLQIASGSLSE